MCSDQSAFRSTIVKENDVYLPVLVMFFSIPMWITDVLSSPQSFNLDHLLKLLKSIGAYPTQLTGSLKPFPADLGQTIWDTLERIPTHWRAQSHTFTDYIYSIWQTLLSSLITQLCN